MSRSRTFWIVAGGSLAAGLLALPAFRVVHRLREENAPIRGERLAVKLGCGACHAPAGGKEIPNPGSRWGSVPVWGNGTLMMYAESPEATEAIIRDGSPRKESGLTPVIFMPAYRSLLDASQIADLAAYVRALERADLPEDAKAKEGADVARKHGCFGCHGPGGAGGVPNPGSATGYVPGFLGPDYAELVRSPGEFREWVRTGGSTRVASQPLAMSFLKAQRISMPAFPREHLTDEEVAGIEAYVAGMRGKRR